MRRLEDVARGAAEDPLAQAAVAVGAHHQQIGALAPGKAQQGVPRADSRLIRQQVRRRREAVAREVGRRALGARAMRFGPQIRP